MENSICEEELEQPAHHKVIFLHIYIYFIVYRYILHLYFIPIHFSNPASSNKRYPNHASLDGASHILFSRSCSSINISQIELQKKIAKNAVVDKSSGSTIAKQQILHFSDPVYTIYFSMCLHCVFFRNYLTYFLQTEQKCIFIYKILFFNFQQIQVKS